MTSVLFMLNTVESQLFCSQSCTKLRLVNCFSSWWKQPSLSSTPDLFLSLNQCKNWRWIRDVKNSRGLRIFFVCLLQTAFRWTVMTTDYEAGVDLEVSRDTSVLLIWAFVCHFLSWRESVVTNRGEVWG